MTSEAYGMEAEEGQGAVVLLALSFCILLVLALIGMIRFKGGESFPLPDGSAARTVQVDVVNS